MSRETRLWALAYAAAFALGAIIAAIPRALNTLFSFGA